MEIRLDDLTELVVQDLVREHLDDMAQKSDPESCHALSVEQLRQSSVTFWSAWDNKELLGCGALKELNPQHGEVKTMRTVARHRGKGVASLMLEHIIAEAKRRRYVRVSLETGSSEHYEPARKLYFKYGFKECAPFADYIEDPESFFMTKEI